MSDYRDKTPWWMSVVIVLCMLPALIFPFNLQSMPEDATAKYLIWFYPAYVIGTGICAWICYPERRIVSWILLALMILSHCAMYFLPQ